MKQLRGYWRRPYQRVTLEGVAPLSIVAFSKHPYEQKHVDNENDGYTYYSKYSYKLMVDLWIVVLRFEWIGRERQKPGSGGDYGG